jgi:hypothetical protein
MRFEGIYCFDRGVVCFAIFPTGAGGPRVLADISEEALAEIFKVRGGGDAWLQGCAANFDVIATAANEKWTAYPGAEVHLEPQDFRHA